MNTLTIDIRNARGRDAAAIADVHQAAWTGAYSGIIPHKALNRMLARRGREWWASAIRRQAGILVIEVGEQVVGYATIGRNRTSQIDADGEIYELYVMPEYQGVGLGSQLFEAARGMLSGQSFGEAGLRVVMEERLEGVEASVHAICDGERALVLPAAQDHKRIGDGDTGPNTGGMGSYAPTPLVSPALMDRVREQIVLPAVRGMAADGHPYRGALFAGLMISPSGEPRLLEFNVRFGDPETQVLMAILRGDLAEALASAARGHLDETQVSITDEHAVCVVLAAAGYPGTPRRGDAITGVERAEQVPGVRVIHAGTARFDGALRTAGGRVLGVTARGDSLAQAHERAYLAADAIEFEGKQLRRDIAARALG